MVTTGEFGSTTYLNQTNLMCCLVAGSCHSVQIFWQLTCFVFYALYRSSCYATFSSKTFNNAI